MPIPPTQYPDKTCPVCGVTFNRRRFGKRLEDPARYLSRQTCSQACGNTKTDVTKGTLHWRARRHAKDSCETCGTNEGLHVHHVDRNPANNDPMNLRTLCDSCHLKLHWREDRDKRLAAIRAAAARRGVTTHPQSTDTNSHRAA